MIGLFDSGLGGINTAEELRRLLPRESLLLLADYERAPFGEKSAEELVPIIEENVRRLLAAGAERVLIACCTASTLHGSLSKEAKEMSIPIIAPTARAANLATKNGKIAVIATEGTVRSHEFKKRLRNRDVLEIPAGELVRISEDGGELDPRLPDALRRIMDSASELGADTLILGCTHFHSLREAITEEAAKRKIKNIISSAKEGATELYRILKGI